MHLHAVIASAGSRLGSRASSSVFRPSTALDTRAQANTFVVFGRIASNLVAGGLIFLSLATLLALLAQGMFDRHVVLTLPPSIDNYWHDYGRNCRLDFNGFVNGSCAEMEVATTTSAAWTALGRQLALHWDLPPASDPWFVTTCSVGPPGIQWVFLVFLGSSTSHPLCVPTAGAQTIDGIAKLETTNRDAYPRGIYELSVLSDAAMVAPSVVHANTDGTNVRRLAGMAQVLVTTDGSSLVDDTGVNTVVTSHPLGPRYAVSTYCQSLFVDGGSTIDTAGWSVGRRSGKVPVVATNAVTVVANYIELSAWQAVLIVAALGLLSGDVIMTVKGLGGVLLRKPVLTYDVLSGLEARQLVLVLLTLNAAPSLLYADVARIYYGTPNANRIWFLSIVLLATFAIYVALLCVVGLQRLPVPSPRLLPFSSRLFVYSSIGTIVYCIYGQFVHVSNAFYAGAWHLPLTIDGVDRPAGAYSTASVACIGSLLLPWLVYPVASCLAFSILSAMSCRYLYYRQWALDTAWMQRNALLSTTRLPRLLTSLPLGEETAISIGHKVFCKPSTQAVLGYATIVEHTTSRVQVALDVCPTSGGKEGDKCFAKLKLHRTTPLMLVVSTYALVPILLGCLRPSSPKGTITGNEFTALTTPASTTTLRKLVGNKKFVHNRGVCLA